MSEATQPDEQLRETVCAELAEPDLPSLRGAEEPCWDEAAWYAPAGQERTRQKPFPVPRACHGWHGIERDPRNGALFRFFTRHAWLSIAAPAGPATLHFTVPHAALPEALERLRLGVCGVPVELRQAPYPDACCEVTVELDDTLVALVRRAGRLTLSLTSPVVARPSLLYPGSRDSRQLTLAITQPRLRER